MNKGVLIHSELTDIFELMRRQRRGDDINDVDADRLLVEAATKVQSNLIFFFFLNITLLLIIFSGG